jgi:signal transduction histidine kinase
MSAAETPSPIERLTGYLREIDDQRQLPFYLLVNDALELADARGQAAHYGFTDLHRGKDLSETLLFLVGMEDTALGQITTLPILDMGQDIYAHVYILRLKNGWGMAFTDACREHAERLRYQQLANELALSERELARKHAELEQAMQAKSLFIGRMSHEFRTPLSSILGFATLAQEDMGDAARLHTDLQAIKRGANYLLSLVDNLLDHSVLEHERLHIRPTACDIGRLVGELEELFQPTARQKGLSMAWWVDVSLPKRLWLDELRLRQVLVNLIGNAIKFTREGAISISLEWADDRLQVAIEDTGTGIPPQDLKRLFKPFSQGPAMEQGQRGAGLGLSISRGIVQAMGGELMLDSQPGRGTRASFHVEAPARDRKSDEERSLHRQRILLLEEDPDTRELLTIFLKGAGARLSVARDADECEALVSQQPELILVNLLPEPRHRLLLRRLQQAGFRGPVLAIGAQDDEGLHKKLKRAGYSGLITKPIRRSELINELAGMLEAPESQQQA